MSDHQYQNWRLEQTDDNILILSFDKPNASVNTIDFSVMSEFSEIIDMLSNHPFCQGVIIASGKKTGFIAGADITSFSKFKNIEEANNVLTQGQQVLNKLAALKIPTVAMIEGFCLGGGLELALACRYRVAEDGIKTRLGLPEVLLGIHPGWGGSVRLPRLIGAPQAFDLILSGKTVSAKAACKMGLVDAAVPKRQLLHAAKYYILKNPGEHQSNTLHKFSNLKFSRLLLGSYLRRKLKQKKVNPLHYPAPYHVVDNWELVGVEGDAAFAREAKSCGKLFFSETSQNLRRVFMLQDQLKNLVSKKSHPIQHVHVIGAGTMGGDIAAWCALSGLTVTLQDLEARFIAPAMQRAKTLFTEKLKEKYLVQKAMDHLIPDLHGYGIAKADLIIEAVIEDLAVKQATFKMIESKANKDAILATNTSSIPLDQINEVLQEPERLVGIHYFNPVAKMKLVEVVQGEKTSQQVMIRAIGFVRQIDKLPLPVKSSPGFLVNRVLMPYLLESIQLLNEGIPASVIDKAMTNFGMPMGPVTLADTIGLDVCLSVANYLANYFNATIPTQLTTLVAQHKLGRKTAEGFYRYDKNGKKQQAESANYTKPLHEISERLVKRMLEEAYRCLDEHVVASADLLDAGMIFGTGFAPFLGGPMHYAKSAHLKLDVKDNISG